MFLFFREINLIFISNSRYLLNTIKANKILLGILSNNSNKRKNIVLYPIYTVYLVLLMLRAMDKHRITTNKNSQLIRRESVGYFHTDKILILMNTSYRKER